MLQKIFRKFVLATEWFNSTIRLMNKAVALAVALTVPLLLAACNASVTDNTTSDEMSSSSIMDDSAMSSDDAMEMTDSGATVDTGTGAVLDNEEEMSSDTGVYEDPADNARD